MTKLAEPQRLCFLLGFAALAIGVAPEKMKEGSVSDEKTTRTISAEKKVNNRGVFVRDRKRGVQRAKDSESFAKHPNHALKVIRHARKVEQHPVATKLADINESELVAEDMEEAFHTLFNVSVMIYAHGDLISDSMRQGGWDTETVQKLCDAFARRGGKGNILDVGANIGTFALPLAACIKEHGAGGNQIVAVEADPTNALHFRAGILKNGFDHVRLYEYAVTSPDETDTLVMRDDLPGNRGMPRIADSAEPSPRDSTLYTVPATTIDDIMEAEGRPMEQVFLMKIDIEGGEDSAVHGAKRFLSSARAPCVIFVERPSQQFVDAIGPGYKKLNWNEDENGEAISWDHDGNGWFERQDMDTCLEQLDA